MPIVNDLTVKFKNGYVVVRHTGSIAFFGPRQGMLELGTIEHELAAVYYGLLHLQAVALPQAVPDVDYQPRDITETPYWAVVPGDKIMSISAQNVPELQRVQSVNVSEDANGEPVFGLTLQTKFQDTVARIGRIIRKAGVAGQGEAELASPAKLQPLTPAVQRSPEWPPFSLPGPAYVIGISGQYAAPHAARIVSFHVTVGALGGGINLSMFRNGAVVASGLLPTSAQWVDIPCNADFRPGDLVGVSVDGVSGTPPNDLLVVPRISA